MLDSSSIETALTVKSVLVVDRQDCQLGWSRGGPACEHVMLHPQSGQWTELPVNWQPASDPDDEWYECSSV